MRSTTWTRSSISHLHYDHLDVQSLRLVGRTSRVVVPVGAGDMLRSRGFAHVTELDVGDDTDVNGVNVSATHAEHGGRQVLGMRVPALGYLVSGSLRIWFAGDTDLFDGMSHVARDLDVALLPVAGWGPRVPRGHLDPERAAQALTLLRPRIAVPIHWGTYRRIGLSSEEELLREPAESFARLAAEVAPGGGRAHPARRRPARAGGRARRGLDVTHELERPRIRPLRLLVAWLISAAALLVRGRDRAGRLGQRLERRARRRRADRGPERDPAAGHRRAPAAVHARRSGFLLVLFLDAAMFKLASDIAPDALTVDSFWWALVAAFVAAVVSVVARPDLPDERRRDVHAARDAADRAPDGRPDRRRTSRGSSSSRSTASRLPILQRAMRDGNAPEMARWVAENGYVLTEWETDLSSQTGASQAGILLGSNEDIPAFRWVEKESGRTMTCSKPDDCAEIERRHSSGVGLLRDGGASRGNLLSGEAEHLILTVSRINEEKRSNPGYRAFFANGFNVTRLLVLFFFEVLLELTAAAREARVATSGRADIAASRTRSCALRCASSSAT